jgi:PDZ domain-containing protein
MNPAEGADNPADHEAAAVPAATGDPDTPVTTAGPDEPGAGARPPRSRRRRVLTRVAVLATLALVALIVAASVVRVPYYKFSPGSLYPTESLVSVNGTDSYLSDGGQIDFTTVSSKKASVLDYLLAGGTLGEQDVARFDEAVEFVDAEKFERGRTPEENRQENLEMMSSSKQMAEVAALRKLGYPVEVHGTGALVKRVDKGRQGRDLPAASVLKVNDTIVEVDGQPIELGEDAVAAIGTHKPGDTITLKVESAPDDPGRTETVTLGSRCDAVLEGECAAGDVDKPLLGVRLSNRDTRFDLPVQLSIDTKDVGGPSAGLALTLGIIDVLTPGSLTGGGHVATTGTIDADGNVGAVGGIRQKTHLVVRQGIPLFLVPAGEEAEEAARYAAGSGTRVIPVSTLDEALTALRDNGGLTDVVGEEAAQRSGTTAPGS